QRKKGPHPLRGRGIARIERPDTGALWHRLEVRAWPRPGAGEVRNPRAQPAPDPGDRRPRPFLDRDVSQGEVRALPPLPPPRLAVTPGGFDHVGPPARGGLRLRYSTCRRRGCPAGTAG